MDFDFDTDKILAEQDQNEKRKRMLAVMGGIGDALSSQQSFGNFLTGKMNPQSTSVSRTADTVAGTIEDPMARRQKLLQGHKSAQEAKQLKAQSDLDTRDRDPNSSESKALKRLAPRWGIQVEDGMSAYDIKQMIDPRKMMETEAQSRVNFENQKELRRLEHKYNLELAGEKALNKQPSGDQQKAAGFAQRITNAEKIMDDLARDPDFDATDRRNWFLKTFSPNEGKSPSLQKLEQAQRNFINAVLRRESGAAISEGEFENAKQQYFPQAGDVEDVLEQKRQNRLDVLAALKSEAGNAFDAVGAQRSQLDSPSPYQTAGGGTRKSSGLNLIPEAKASENMTPQVKEVGGVMYKKVNGGWEPM